MKSCLPPSFLGTIARTQIHVREKHTYVQDPISPLPSPKDASGLRKTRVWVLSAPCGRGKSQFFKRIVQKMFSKSARILSVTPRVSLAVAQSALLEGLGFAPYHTMKNVADEISSANRCICEYESLHHMDAAALSREWDLVVCDEIRSTLCSVSSSATNRAHLVANAAALTRILSRARCILLMDADIESDGAVARMLSGVLQEPPDRVHYELYPPLPRGGRREDRELVLIADEAAFWSAISTAIRKGERVAVVCALRKQALGYAEACVDAGLARSDEIGCYTSDMSESAVAQVFSNFDAATRGKRLVVFTSKVSVGIDASVTRPHRIFMDFRRPVQVARVALQMLYRFRHPIDGSTLCLVPDPSPHDDGDETVPPRSLKDIIHLEETEMKKLRDEMRVRGRALAACDAATGSSSSRVAPPELLTLSIASTRAERRRDFVVDLVRLSMAKGIRVRRASPDGDGYEQDRCDMASMNKALSSVRTRDEKFIHTVAINVLRASQSRGELKRMVGAPRLPGSATRESRALDSGSVALMCHPGVVGAAGGILGRRGSMEWDRLSFCGRLRDVAHCYIATGDGSEVRRAAFNMPAVPNIARSLSNACAHVYFEAVAAHSTGRSRRISALQQSSTAGGSQHDAGTPSMLTRLSDATKKLIRLDIASQGEYGSAAVSKSEVGAFRACEVILRHCLGAREGGLIEVARRAVAALGDSAPVLAAIPLRLDALYSDSAQGASTRRRCVNMAREALMLCQTVLSGREYATASRYDGTRGGPRVGSRANVCTEAEKAFRLASAALFYVYGILVVPRESLELAINRAITGSWNLRGCRSVLTSRCAYVAVVDHVRWSLARAFVPPIRN